MKKFRKINTNKPKFVVDFWLINGEPQSRTQALSVKGARPTLFAKQRIKFSPAQLPKNPAPPLQYVKVDTS